MQSHIITLKGHALSERLSQECQAQAALFGINVQIRDAINGHHYKEHLERTGLNPVTSIREKKRTPGMFGNFLSHYYLWQQCARGTEPYLILEHDGYFVRPLPTDALDRFTHVLKLDDVDPYNKDYHTIMQQQHQEQKPTEILPMDITGRSNKGSGFYTPGSYAYIIKPAAGRLLIDWVSNNGFLPTVVRLHPLFAEGDNIHTLSTAKFADQLPNNL